MTTARICEGTPEFHSDWKSRARAGLLEGNGPGTRRTPGARVLWLLPSWGRGLQAPGPARKASATKDLSGSGRQTGQPPSKAALGSATVEAAATAKASQPHGPMKCPSCAREHAGHSKQQWQATKIRYRQPEVSQADGLVQYKSSAAAPALILCQGFVSQSCPRFFPPWNNGTPSATLSSSRNRCCSVGTAHEASLASCLARPVPLTYRALSATRLYSNKLSVYVAVAAT